MKILGVDCSAGPASCAVCDGKRLLGQFFIDVRRTHSETLLPMVEALLSSVNVPLGEIEGFAVTAGPGSFTGVRIGVAAVKGMAQPKGKKCAGVSTLEAVARVHFEKAVICAVMDARRSRVYNALFETGETFVRLCPDRAVSLGELAADLGRLREARPNAEILLAGDGAEITAAALPFPWVKTAPPPLNRQTAYGAVLAAEETFINGGGVPPEELCPVYLRPPQAELRRAGG